MARQRLTPYEAQRAARELSWLWPQAWLRTPSSVWRCILLTWSIAGLAVVILLMAQGWAAVHG